MSPIKQYGMVLALAMVFATCLANPSHSLKLTTQTYEIHYPTEVNQLLSQLNPQNMWNNLITLTQFPDRSVKHESGVAAANWLKTQIETAIKNAGRNDAQVFTVETKGTDPETNKLFQEKQPSIVLKIGTSSSPGVVIGAHFDTFGCYSTKGGYHEDEGCLEDPYGPLPGANDDGSGTVAVLELARTLLESHMRFKNPIYLILYAGEEEGDWGAISVTEYFKNNSIPVKAIMQLDQIGFAYQNDPTIWLETNEDRVYKVVNDDLTQYLITLTKTYVKKPVVLSCSGSSDEKIWTDKGFAAVRPLEADYCDFHHMYQDFHTNQDTLDKVSLAHMTDYLKLATAFIVELAEPFK